MLVVSDRSFTKGLFFVLVIVSMAVSLGAMLLVGGGPVLAKSGVAPIWWTVNRYYAESS